MSDYYSESVADLPLFSPPAQRHSETSRAAAASLDGDALNAMQRRVLEYLETHGPSTDEEIATGLDMNPSTERPGGSNCRSAAWSSRPGRGRRPVGVRRWFGKQRRRY
jgi:hypothetical protein